MKMLQIAGIFCLFAACGGDTDGDDPEPEVIRTAEVCKVDTDCKMDPGRVFCREPRTAVRYEIATCSADQRCAWSRLENECNLRCEEGYCITAGGR
jgi:hypothetical protein